MSGRPALLANDQRRGQLAIATAAVCWSLAGTLQRELSVDTATQIAGRSGAAAVMLTVLTTVQSGGHPVAAFRSVGRAGVVLGCCMGGAAGAFIIALNRATVASVLFMQALAPLVAIILAWLFLHERASPRTWIATGVALGGVLLMVGGPGGSSRVGVLASFVMTVLFATTIVIARHRRSISMTPAVALSQIILFAASAPFASFSTVSGRDLLLLLTLGIVQTGLGQAFFVIGARLISAAEVAMITVLEVILGPLWVWLFQSERPSNSTLLGGAIVLVAVIVQATESGAADEVDSPTAASSVPLGDLAGPTPTG